MYITICQDQTFSFLNIFNISDILSFLDMFFSHRTIIVIDFQSHFFHKAVLLWPNAKKKIFYQNSIEKARGVIRGKLVAIFPLRWTNNWILIWCPDTGWYFGVCNQPLGRSKADSVFHPSKVLQMSTRNSWELVVKSLLAASLRP